MTPTKPPPNPKSGLRPFRTAVFRGLGVVLPPLITIAILLWLGGTIQNNVFEPISAGVQNIVVRLIQDVRQQTDFPPAEHGNTYPMYDGVAYRRLEDGTCIPKTIYDKVDNRRGEDPMPRTAPYIYQAYLRLKYLRPAVMIPLFLCGFILILYLLGKLIAAGVGRFTMGLVERGISRVPFVRSVYSAVKQVSSFLLNERTMDVSQVVAVEYPRKGVWTLGLVTGVGMPAIESIVGDECISVMICTSPMPMAGFTINVRKSEAIDLNITLDQAIQFIVSCGVVVPGSKDLPLADTAGEAPRQIAEGPPPESDGNP
jgi:uncharacterized membrane protein